MLPNHQKYLNHLFNIIKYRFLKELMNIQISVIICTYGPSKYLRTAINSVINQTISPDTYEIIIVDGNFKNDKNSLFIEFNEFPNFQYIKEQTPGLSVARNTGCLLAKGQIIAFMDDDAIADINWLKNIHNTFSKNSEDVAAVGGKIEPIFEKEKPAWLSDDLLNGLSLLDLGDFSIILNPEQFLYGTNMAFRRAVVAKLNGFNKNLGRKGKNLLSNEEIYLQKKISKTGHLRIYNPEIKVKHHISAHRLTKEWLIERYYWQGISNSVMKRIEDNPSKLERWYLAFLKAFHLFGFVKDIKGVFINRNESDDFMRKCSAYHSIGEIIGMMKALE